jgi:hypothetical protein
MKKHAYYYPRKVADQRKWWLTYKTNIALFGTALGMTAPQITAEQAFCDAVILSIDAAVLAAAEAKSKNQARNKTIQTNYSQMAPLIKLHKLHTGYTEAIGKELGIVGGEIKIDWNIVKTVVNISLLATGVSIKLELMNCEAANIYSKRGNEDSFSLFKTITHPATVDSRPNIDGAASELRQYYVVMVVGDKEVGIASDIVTISR